MPLGDGKTKVRVVGKKKGATAWLGKWKCAKCGTEAGTGMGGAVYFDLDNHGVLMIRLCRKHFLEVQGFARCLTPAVVESELAELGV